VRHPHKRNGTIMVDRLQALWVTEPVRVTALVVAAVMFIASQVGVVLDPLTVAQYVVIAATVVFGTEVASDSGAAVHSR
jgi:hypothetical protein